MIAKPHGADSLSRTTGRGQAAVALRAILDKESAPCPSLTMTRKGGTGFLSYGDTILNYISIVRS